MRSASASSPPALRERVELGREPRDDGEAPFVALDCRSGAAALLQQVERDRGLIREQAEQIHLGEAEARALPVEHLEDAECPVAAEERHRHQTARHVAGRLRGLTREARIAAHVVEHERLPCGEHPARDSRSLRQPLPEERLGALAGDGLEDEFAGSSSSRKIDDALAPKIARAVSTIERSRSR